MNRLKSHHSINIDWFGILGIVALCLLSRLPLLMSPYFMPNGDECVLGLMAKHMAEGREFPFYFWGQHYGFSLIEAGAVSLAIKCFGIGVFSLKVPMLFLWTLGCIFFYVALGQWTTKIYSFWITCLLILSPAWSGWSMQARGGYITAFLLSTIIIFLIGRNGQSLKRSSCLYIGILSGFIFFSQPIYLLGVLPLLIFTIFRKRMNISIFICITGFIGIFILGKVASHFQSNTDYWEPILYRSYNFGAFFSSVKDILFKALNQDAGSYWAAVTISKAWSVIFLIALLFTVLGLITKKTMFFLAPFLIGPVLILGYSFLFNCGGPNRYLLSLSVFLILWVGILNFVLMNKNMFFKALWGLVVSVLIILGIFATWNYKKSAKSNEISDVQKISNVIQFLKASGVKYVFSCDGQQQWQIMFFSNEEIISSWSFCPDRHPAYCQAVTQAFLNGQKVALVGLISQQIFNRIATTKSRQAVFVGPYFVYMSPSKELMINKLGYQLYKFLQIIEHTK